MAKSLALSTQALAPGLVLSLALAVLAGGASADEPKVCGGRHDVGCDPADYCRVEPPARPHGKGVCVPKPEICNMLYQPVCGGDGRTYPNACHAARKGVNVARKGRCED